MTRQPDLNDLVEIAPGRFKKLAECRAVDLEGALAVADEKMALHERRLLLMDRIIGAASCEGLDGIPVAPELFERMQRLLRGGDGEEWERLLELRREVQLLELSAAMLAVPRGSG